MLKNISILILFNFALTVFSYSQSASDQEITFAGDAIDKGANYAKRGNFEKAVELFDKAIELNPFYAQAFLYRGLARTELGYYEDAITDYNIALELDPGFSEQVHYFRGITKSLNNDYHGSMKDLSIAIRLNPDFLVYLQRGKVHFSVNDYSMAIQDLDISYNLNPEYGKTLLYRGATLYYLGQYKAAIEDLLIAREKLPQNYKVYYYAGLAKIANENSYAAIENLNKCIELNPTFYKAYEARAKARINTGNMAAAEADKEKSKQLMAEAGIDKKAEDISPKEIPPVKEYPEYTKKPTTESRDDKTDSKHLSEKTETTDKEKTTHDAKTREVSRQPSKDIDIASFFHSGSKETEEHDKDDEADAEKTDISSKDHTVSKKPKKPEIESLNSGFYSHNLNNLKPLGFGVQIASYSNTDNLQRLASAYEDEYKEPVFINIASINGQKVYRIIIGEFNERKQAEEFRDKLRDSQFSDSFLVAFERMY